MLHERLSIIVPFYNPPYALFEQCLMHLKALKAYEVLLVDDCSSEPKSIALAQKSGFTYLKTPYQSGHDGLPFNLGLQQAKGHYVCKVDADDFFLEIPHSIAYKIHLARMNRSADPTTLSLEELILSPRSIHNGAIIETSLAQQFPFIQEGNIFNDVLVLLRLLYHQEAFSVHPTINYIYNATAHSMQISKPYYYHRLSHIQTIAHFCQLEHLSPKQSEYFLSLAMLNLRYGSKARSFLNHNQINKGEKR